MTLTACRHAPRNDENRGKKQQSKKTSKKSNITTYEYAKCVLFWFETKTLLEWNTP